MTTLADASLSDEQSTQTSPRGHVPGEAGLWVLLFGDMLVFTMLFGVYLYQRRQQPRLFEEFQATVDRNLGTLNTLLLLVSSLLVVLATRAVRRSAQRHLAPRLLLGAITCGIGFVAVKAFEYHEELTGSSTTATNTFRLYYFALTGLHLAHLVFGLLVLIGLWTLSRKRDLTRTHHMFFEGGACFWHMVDLLWMMIFPLVYLVR
ncbi:cytochrome c oxidase subunit 3 family protein [Nocardia sp. ET3-3]|uniref:Cytochrome aa3 subunit 3 n=2 Tax=Nocardia terrae TaxID=2675851 RepID=A0A7K1V2M7_9NOCA|nr:cytochrome c oxidase subunit 3 family protein [Nocardia terrae]